MHGIIRGSFRLSSMPAVALFDLKFMDAIATFHVHVHEPSIARIRLVKAIEQRATTTDQRCKVHEAQHCLAITYVRLSDLDSANKICKSAFEGRRRLLGRQDESSVDSLGLMSRIHELQGNKFRAQIYLTMIPEAQIDIIKAKYQSILYPKALDSPRESGAVVPLHSNDLTGLGISNLHVGDSSHEPELDVSAQSGADEQVSDEEYVSAEEHVTGEARSLSCNPPQLFLTNTEPDMKNVPSSEISDPPHDRLSPLLPSPVFPSTHHRRNQSAPLVSRTVPGSPLLPSPRALEPISPRPRPLGTTGLFRGVDNRTRRACLASLNLYPSGAFEAAVCNGDLMALHAALNMESDFHNRPSFKFGNRSHSRSRALHLAALFGDVRMAHALIIARFDVHATIPKVAVPGRRLFTRGALYEFETALHMAIGSRQAPMVEYLLGQGASLHDSRFNLDLPTTNLLDIDWLRATQCANSQEIVDVLRVLLDTRWTLNRPLSIRGPERESVVQTLSRHSNWPFENTRVLEFCRESSYFAKEWQYDGGDFAKTVVGVNDIDKVKAFVNGTPAVDIIQYESHPGIS